MTNTNYQKIFLELLFVHYNLNEEYRKKYYEERKEKYKEYHRNYYLKNKNKSNESKID